MWLDALVLALIAGLAWSGARAGAGVSGVRLLALPLAYAAAFGAGYAFGPALARELGGSLLVASLAASSAGFVLATLATWLVLRAVRDRAADASPAGQALGALFGALRGVLFALPLLWLGGLAEGARSSGLRPELPDLSSAHLTAFSERALAAAAARVVDVRAASGRMALQLAARPGETLAGLQGALRDPRFVTLQHDPGFWHDVERGAVTSALARPTARALVRDAGFRRELAALGAVSPEAGGNARAFERELAAALAEVGPRIAAIRSDPAFAALQNDPALREDLARGNTLALLRDARFRGLVERAAR